MSRPYDESIWGSINTCLEIGLEIYQMFCRTKDGEDKSGIAIPIDRAKEVLPENALSLGTEKDGYIYYENPTQTLVPIYELLKSGAITDEEFTSAVDVEHIENRGKAAVPEYFGSLPIPRAADNEAVTEIHNGVSMIKGEHDFFIAIHNSLAYNSLCLPALELGIMKDEFVIFTSETCAVPIYELSFIHPKINDFIINKESLEQTLTERFPAFTEYWNNTHAQPGTEIKANGSIAVLFLQAHYDYEAERFHETLNAFEATNEYEQNTGFEQADEEWELEL